MNYFRISEHILKIYINGDIMNFRTDLACELKTDLNKKTGGVSAKEEKYGEIIINTITVENEIGERLLGKPKGTYYTFTLPEYSENSTDNITVKLICTRLRHLLPKKQGTVLVVGLGNRDITPDALGPFASKNVLATRHIRSEILAENDFEDLKPVAVLAPGVLGKTGIETLEIIKGAVNTVKPSAVIVIDAFAARSAERLGKTVQLASSGICPGSGVGNSRKAVTRESLGVPVISIGVPTVVDALTLAGDAAGENANLPQSISEMFVTPREIDLIIERSAKIISESINAALQPAYTIDEINDLL